MSPSERNEDLVPRLLSIYLVCLEEIKLDIFLGTHLIHAPPHFSPFFLRYGLFSAIDYVTKDSR